MPAIESTSDAFNATHPIATVKYGLGGDASLITGVHIRWDVAFVGTFTFWVCDFPPQEILITDVVAGNWIQQQPTTGYTPISPPGAATVPVSPLVIVVAGGTAGGAAPDIGNLGHKRLAIQVACSTPGVVRIRANGKD